MTLVLQVRESNIKTKFEHREQLQYRLQLLRAKCITLSFPLSINAESIILSMILKITENRDIYINFGTLTNI